MSTPPPVLVSAIRTGAVVRELFFKLDHPSGIVRAWSGVGEFVLDGETYEGVYGLASVSGVEETSDIQTHDVEVELQGIPFSAAADLSLPVRNRAAQIVALWRNASGEQVGPARTIFKGKADVLTVGHTGDALTARLTLRSAAFDFRLTGQSYYSDAEQAVRFPGDTGFSGMAGLTNRSSAGWSLSATGADTIYVTASGTGSAFVIEDTAGRRVVTDADTHFKRTGNNVMFPGTISVSSPSGTIVLDELHLAIVPTIVNATAYGGGTIKVTSGQWRPCIIDGSGNVRAGTTTGERLIVASDLRVYGETTGLRAMLVAATTRYTSTATDGLQLRAYNAKFAKARPA